MSASDASPDPDDTRDAQDPDVDDGPLSDQQAGDPGTEDEGIGADRAVLDRIVDGTTAVLLVGPQGTQRTLPADGLPEGVRDGTWLIVDLGTDPLTVVGVDRHLTDVRSGDVSRRMARLRQQRRGGRFNR